MIAAIPDCALPVNTPSKTRITNGTKKAPVIAPATAPVTLDPFGGQRCDSPSRWAVRQSGQIGTNQSRVSFFASFFLGFCFRVDGSPGGGGGVDSRAFNVALKSGGRRTVVSR